MAVTPFQQLELNKQPLINSIGGLCPFDKIITNWSNNERIGNHEHSRRKHILKNNFGMGGIFEAKHKIQKPKGKW